MLGHSTMLLLPDTMPGVLGELLELPWSAGEQTGGADYVSALGGGQIACMYVCDCVCVCVCVCSLCMCVCVCVCVLSMHVCDLDLTSLTLP